MFIYIILGLIQGITEPLPISSSGHLLIIKNLFNSNINYEILATITNFGSFLAILVLFKEEIHTLIKGSFSKNDKYFKLIIIGTIPAGIIGLLIKKINLFTHIENNVKIVGIALIITGIILFLIRNIQGYKEKENISFKDAFIIGIFQTIALIPGISRSGSTIVGGMFQNLKRETAFNFSFMLYIPISICTTIIGIKDIINYKLTINQYMLYITSMIISFISTYIFTKLYKQVVIKGKLLYFVYYCIVVGILILFFN